MCAFTKVITDVFRLGQEAMENMAGVVPGQEKKQFFARILSEFAQSAEGSITITQSFYHMYYYSSDSVSLRFVNLN